MTRLTYHQAWAFAAATTLAVELVVVLLVAQRVRLLVSRARLVGVAVLANALTHPALWYLPWFFFPSVLRPENHSLYVAVGESAALVVESLAYWLLVVRHRPWLAIALSALANAASYGAGIAIGKVFG